jgi:pyridoxamine 5'-phosphate oxidase
LDIEQIRREYLKGGLSRKQLDKNPFIQFRLWLCQAIESELVDPTAMSIATVSAAGQPSLRTVLLKHSDEEGFVFYTNLGSRKAQEIEANQKVSLLFTWLALERQIVICGVAERVSTTQALQYFLSRPRESQLAAWTSNQSQKVSSRQLLEQQFLGMKEKFSKGEIPLPSFWGGYRVKPHEIQFWQGRENRMHDRFRYDLQSRDDWEITRLAP